MKKVSVAFRVCLVVLALFLAAGRESYPGEVAGGPALGSLRGKRIGVLDGSMNAEAAREKIQEFTMLHFMHNPEMVEGLKSGRVDAILSDAPFLAMLAARDPSVALVREKLEDYDYALAVHKDNKNLADKVNAVLREFMQDGTLRRLHGKWLTGPEAERTLPQPPAGGGVLRVGVVDVGQPFAYQNADGKLVGYDIELATLVAAKLGLRAEFKELLFAHLVQDVVNKNVDIAISSLSINPERAELILFTEPYFRSGSAAMVRSGR